MRQLRAVPAAVLAAALAAGACGTSRWDDAAQPLRSDAPLSATVPPAVPTAVPTSATQTAASTPVPDKLRFRAKTLDGQAFDGTSLAGRPVVFWFWAPWCPKCRSEAPAVKAAADRFRDVAFVGVAGLDGEAAMKEFVRRTGTGGIIQLSDEKGAVWTKLGVAEQSTFLFMTPDGRTDRASGPLGTDELASRVARLLGR
ncbi:TlpA family protein disulfide reductase [Thermoactinospora rubra]|uniref:TlpA family protein disulfide reductase n=1 Tax=Thermoactinospora rubra TaxID=1088767 RepID=UPI000A1160A7|nr:redoxin domain-containing protein [Thermoactinospora rubra]